MNSILINTTNVWTAEKVLEERKKKMMSGTLAHSVKVNDEFYAKLDCSCHTCRNVLDPTGEEDAKLWNAQILETMTTKEETRPRGLSLNLPPPSPAVRLTAAPTGLISPLTGIISPRSLSDTSVGLEDQMRICYEMEEKVKRYLKRLAKNYEALQVLIDSEKEPGSHDEMAASDTWWTEVDRKKSTTEELLILLE